LLVCHVVRDVIAVGINKLRVIAVE
jgi:hypothetical protein